MGAIVRYKPTAKQVALQELIRDKTRILAYGGRAPAKLLKYATLLR